MSSICNDLNIVKTNQYQKINGKMYRQDLININLSNKKELEQLLELIAEGVRKGCGYDMVGNMHYNIKENQITGQVSLVDLKIRCFKEE